MVPPAPTRFSKFFALEIFMIGLAGIIAGTLYLLGIFATYGHIIYNDPPGRIAQGIATILFGNAAYVGGAGTAYWGVGLNYFITLFFAVMYFMLYLLLPLFREQKLAGGLLFGLGTWLFMNFIVLPLSNAGLPRFTIQSVGWGLLVTVFLLSLPIVFIMHLYFRRRKK